MMFRTGASWYEVGRNEGEPETTLETISRVLKEFSLSLISLDYHTINHGWEIVFQGTEENCKRYLKSDDGGNWADEDIIDLDMIYPAPVIE